MSLTAILLITISVFAHVGWNFLSKRQNPSGAFFGLALIASTLSVVPILIIYRTTLPLISTTVWGLVVLTGIFETVYYVGLAGAYQQGDMSLAYPLVRAIPILLVTGYTIIFGRGTPLVLFGLVGIIIIAMGCLVLPLQTFQSIRPGNYLNLCCLLALFAAIGTTGYTLTDDAALHQLQTYLQPDLTLNEITLLYIALQTASTGITLMTYVILHPPERHRLQTIWDTAKGQAIGAGLMMTLAYGLVLASMAYVSNVSYVAAFRQLSIPLGAIVGIIALKEPHYSPKVIGIGIIFIGLVLVALT